MRRARRSDAEPTSSRQRRAPVVISDEVVVGDLLLFDLSAENLARRLMDDNLHAPTLSFPVPGTRMVEPTEIESKAEPDRFIAAMVTIREEIRAVEEGRVDRGDKPLKNAPHAAAMVMAETWAHDYTREQATFLLPSLKRQKYWSPARCLECGEDAPNDGTCTVATVSRNAARCRGCLFRLARAAGGYGTIAIHQSTGR